MTGCGNSSNNRYSCTEIKLPAGKVIEEEERLCSLCEDVIHTHRHQVLTDGIVLIAELGDLQNINSRTR